MFVCVPDVSGILCLLWDGSISFWHQPGCIEACGGGSPITRELNIGIGRHWGRGWCAIIINIMRAGRWRLSSDTVKPSMYFLYLFAYLCVCSWTVKQKQKSGVVELVSSGGDLRPVVAANPSFSNPYVRCVFLIIIVVVLTITNVVVPANFSFSNACGSIFVVSSS